MATFVIVATFLLRYRNLDASGMVFSFIVLRLPSSDIHRQMPPQRSLGSSN